MPVSRQGSANFRSSTIRANSDKLAVSISIVTRSWASPNADQYADAADSNQLVKLLRPSSADILKNQLDHVFDYAEHSYGKLIRVEFLKKLRDEEKFIDVPSLTAAIARDAEQARAYFMQQTSVAITATDRI